MHCILDYPCADYPVDVLSARDLTLLMTNHECGKSRDLGPNAWTKSSVEEQDRKSTYERNIDARSRNNCCLAKTRNIKYSDCLFVPIFI